MAKNSAKSKGYRKTAVKKAYISKKEIITVCAVAAALILAVILFNVFYNDGALKVVDGVAQTEGSNSMIVKGGTVEYPRYYKVGQLAEIEGYTLTSALLGSDPNVCSFTYTPDDTSVIDTATLHSYIATADTLIEALAASYDTYEVVNRSDILTTEINGHAVKYIVWSTDPTAAAEASTEEDAIEYMQVVNAYVDIGPRSVSLQLRKDFQSADEYVEDTALVEVMNEILSALSYETV